MAVRDISGTGPFSDPVARMENISKAFSGVVALRGVNLDVREGEIHALVGENGAGKSTLMRVLAGVCQKDGGTIFLNGKPVDIRSPREALSLGISMIHQELNPIRDMRVAEYFVLGREPCYRFAGVVNRRKERECTQKLFKPLNIEIEPDVTMGSLSIADMQMVEIAKAISYDSRIVIMDEPTSAITEREATKLFETIQSLRSRGIAIIYISHRLDEIFRIADTITVLRDGQHVATHPAKELEENALIRLMVGRSIEELFPKAESKKGGFLLEVDGLTKRGLFQDVSFGVRRGEVLGFAGLMGAGRTEIVETVFGLHRADSGTIKIDGSTVTIKSPADAIRNRIALITDDRQTKGLNLKASVKENITLVSLRNLSRFGQILLLDAEKRAANGQIEKLRIKLNSISQRVSTLSGGNQQKVVLAKWLLNDPEIIVLDEPTRGVDIGAKVEIYKIIGQLAAEGKAIIVVSSELPEIFGICDRVIVIHRGRMSGAFQRHEFDQERIIKAAMGNEYELGYVRTSWDSQEDSSRTR